MELNMNLSSGNKIVDSMNRLNITGNVIPMSWYQIFNNKTTAPEASGKIRLLAINILADIVYWYKPTEIRDEKSGFVIGYKKKFKSDLLQRSYEDLTKMFMCSKKDAQRAITFLEQFGVIKRVFRTLKVSGVTVANVLFLQLNVDVLKSLNGMDEIVHIGKQYSPEQNTISSTCKNLFVQTNTETTTETTPYTTTETTYSNKKVSNARAREGGDEKLLGEVKDVTKNEGNNEGNEGANRETFDQIIEKHIKKGFATSANQRNELKQKLKEFLQLRFFHKKGFTNKSLMSFLEKLLDVGNYSVKFQIDCIQNAITGGYNDIVPLDYTSIFEDSQEMWKSRLVMKLACIELERLNKKYCKDYELGLNEYYFFNSIISDNLTYKPEKQILEHLRNNEEEIISLLDHNR